MKNKQKVFFEPNARNGKIEVTIEREQTCDGGSVALVQVFGLSESASLRSPVNRCRSVHSVLRRRGEHTIRVHHAA